MIGWPVSHSRSPLIHNYWIHQHGLAAEYRREAVRPEDFAAFAAGLAGRGYRGANVTLPHKEAALALALPDDRARAVGAANTLWLEGATLCATNTDVEGFLANLDAAAPGWDHDLASAMVLGAGGAARGVVYGLLERGVKAIHVANRTPERTQALRDRFGDAVRPLAWQEKENLFPNVGLLVNTTSLGMSGQPPLDIDLGGLPDGAVVSDIVYSPLETPLLVAAAKRGLRRADGLGMLLHQAVRGFALWFGVTPEVTPALRALVETDLTRQ